jgi:excisionase family DNA binding protein
MESRIDSSGDDEASRIKKKLDKLAEEIKSLPPERIDELERLVHSMGKKVVSIREAAEILDVSTDTIRRAIKSGALRAFQINKAGNWKITIEELERFMRGEK